MVTEAVVVGRPSRRGPARSKRERPNVLGALGGFAWLLFAVVPVYYVVITSLKTQQNFFSGNALLPPANPTLDNYLLVLQNDFLTYFLNSVVVTVVTVVVSVACALMAAYAIVRGAGTN